jgi:hypothetical protein
MRRPARRRRPGTRGARLVGFATVVQVIPGTVAPCPDTAGRRRPAAADGPERAPPRNPTARRNRCRAWRQRTEQHTGHGNTYVAVTLGNAAAGAAKTAPFLGERHRRIARRRGLRTRHRRHWALHPRHRLAPAVRPRRRFHDLGPGFYAARIDPERCKRNHIRQLEALGYTVTLQPAV